MKNPIQNKALQPEIQPIQQDEQQPFLYLDDIQKNLDFLYRYTDVVSSMRLFGFTDQAAVQAISSYSLRDFGHDVTVDGVCELGIFGLAELMLKFLDSGRKQLLGRVTGSKFYCDEVIRVFYDLSKIPILERLAVERKRADFEAKRAEESNSKLADIGNKGKTRTQNARETKNANSKIPEINIWLAEQDKAGCLMERRISNEGAKKFSKTSSYIAKLRRKYLASKTATSVR